MLKSTGLGLFVALSVVACGGDEFQAGNQTSGTPPTTSGAGGDGAGASAGGEGNKGGGGGAGNAGGNGGTGGCSVGSTCIPTPPEGWSALGFFATGTDAPPAECPETSTGSIEGGSGDFTAAPATCTACDCAAPTGISCSIPTFNYYSSQTACNGLLGSGPLNTSCSAVPAGTFSLIETTANSMQGGSCAPTGGVPTVPPHQFAENSLFCEGVGGGASCDGGTCVADAPAPFHAGACIHHEGDVVDCPAGFPEKFVISTGVEDDRGCDDCQCANPTGASCANAVTAHPTAACNSAAPIPISLDPPCISSASAFLFLRFDDEAVGGDCVESGGGVIGTATPTDPVTVCCSAL